MGKQTRARLSRWVTPLWPVTIVGMMAGAALGGFALSAKGPATAAAVIRIEQPIGPNQIMAGSSQPPDTQQSYISGEIAYLKSPGFADVVATELQQKTRPTLSAVQDAQSTLITLSASAPDAQQAQKTVDAAIKAYHDHLQQQAQEQGQAAIDAINAVIDQVNGSARPGTGNARIEQLDNQRLAIQVQAQRAAGPEIVAPPLPTEVNGAPGWALGAVGGGFLGGIGALAAALGWRRWVGAISSPAGLADEVDHLLQPVVDLGSPADDTHADAGLARSLFAQLPTPRDGHLLVVGASANSGSADVARLIAFAADEQGVEATVVDGGSLDTSPSLPQDAATARQIIVVVMLGRDLAESVQIVAQFARRAGVPVSTVLTRRPVWSR